MERSFRGRKAETDRARFASIIRGRGRHLAPDLDVEHPAMNDPGGSGDHGGQAVHNLMTGVGGARSRRREDELVEGLRTLNVSQARNMESGGGQRSVPFRPIRGSTERPQDLNPDLLRQARRTNLEEYPRAPENYEDDVWICAEEMPDLNEKGGFRTFKGEMVRWVEDGDCLEETMKELDLWNTPVIGLDFEFSAGQTYEGFICLASVASPDWTLLVDCLNDRRRGVTVQKLLSDLGESSDVVKVVCGGHNDLTRMKKDWGCYPVNIVDIQELYMKWVEQNSSQCFKRSVVALREQAAKSQGRDQTDAALRRFMENELRMPGLGYLMRVFEIKDVKDSRLTMENWTRRPVPANMQLYAAKDAYYTLRIFYELLNLVGMDAVREVAKSTARKGVGKAPNYKLPKTLALDRISRAIVDWREYLAKTCDWKPDQILRADNISILSKRVSSNSFDQQNYDELLKELLKLNFKEKYAPAVRLLAAHLNPDGAELLKMKFTICHNCNREGHVAFFCPTDPNAASKKAFMSRPENLPLQIARNERKIAKLAEKSGKTVEELRPQLLEKWKKQQGPQKRN